ncbi:MAG TPA: FAD-dependent oxidoreductase, partial [Pyrinomonadaceae bacterium]|nr:FAD-dependent oxidoreductase [Pyrinomonadaceae bacterium]
LMGSARVIFDANPIGATCARVCPVEALCEGACVEKTLLQKPIEIGRLQRYATDHALSNGKQIFEKGEPNGKSVGIIGSGPAGISCAAYLVRLGYDVTVYERKPLAGGLDTYGMAEYKMPQSVSLTESERIAAMGVKFMLNTEITAGDDETEILGDVNRVSFAMLKEWHDAIFVGVGLGNTNKLGIVGEDLEGVYDALDFIEKVKTRDWDSVPLGKMVAVIGAGNTAIDAVTQAKRLGAARVLMVYRKTAREMPAYDYEFELAKQDGIEFVWQAAPIGILSDDGKRVSALRCERTDGSLEVFEIPCDMIIKAVGQTKQKAFFEKVIDVETDGRGRVIVDKNMETSEPRIFAGGDCVNGGGEAVEAAQMGKLAAQGIHRALMGEMVEFAGASVKPIVVDPHQH